MNSSRHFFWIQQAPHTNIVPRPKPATTSQIYHRQPCCPSSNLKVPLACWRLCLSSKDTRTTKVTAESLARQGGRSTAQLDTWRRTAQTHEQAAMGQPTSRTRKKSKNGLKKLEQRIDGPQTWWTFGRIRRIKLGTELGGAKRAHEHGYISHVGIQVIRP